MPRLSNDTFNPAHNLGYSGCCRKPRAWRWPSAPANRCAIPRSAFDVALVAREYQQRPAPFPARVQGNVVTLKLTCYEFWDDYKAKKAPRRDTVSVTPLDQQKILMNGKSYIRCKPIAGTAPRSPAPCFNIASNFIAMPLCPGCDSA
jgi:hypothetical protein